jgi:hypothetical protein
MPWTLFLLRLAAAQLSCAFLAQMQVPCEGRLAAKQWDTRKKELDSRTETIAGVGGITLCVANWLQHTRCAKYPCCCAQKALQASKLPVHPCSL